MRIVIPVTDAGTVEPRWGKAPQVAIVDVVDGHIDAWDVIAVGWDVAHDRGAEGAHHARIVRFLLDHGIEAVVVNHMGAPMITTITKLGLPIYQTFRTDAREAVLEAALAIEQQCRATDRSVGPAGPSA